jgi:hypothetical protein
MAIQKRWFIAAVLLSLASILYGAGRHYSPFLIQYVVEQSLIQKAPAGADPVLLQNRLRAVLSAIPGSDAKIKRLLRTSESLEKTQSLTPEDVDKLMAPEKR